MVTRLLSTTSSNSNERVLRSFEEYSNIYFAKTNNKIKILQSTYDLNEMLNQFGIKPMIRSQFVGTCLLALKNNFVFKGLTNKQIRSGIEDTLTLLLDKSNKNKYFKNENSRFARH